MDNWGHARPDDVNWDNFFVLRTEVNKKLEELRRNGSIGKSEEACLDIHLEGNKKDLKGLLDSDLIKQLCKVSEMFYSAECLENWGKQTTFACKVEASSLKENTDYVQCPRCFKYSCIRGEAPNFDNLCNRCCRVLVNHHPNHPAVPNILRVLYDQNEVRRPSAVQQEV